MGRMSGPLAQGVASGVARAHRVGGAATPSRRGGETCGGCWRANAPTESNPTPTSCVAGAGVPSAPMAAIGPTAPGFRGRRAEVRARFRLEEGAERLTAAMALGRGIVMALPHVGSWEWGGAWLALEGMPMTAVVERLEPERLFDWFVAQRASMGLTAVPLGEGSSAAMLRTLKDGEIAGLVSDRDLAGNGVEVEFFGERTTMPGGAAMLALRSGAPLLPVVVYSGPGDWHTGVVHPALDTQRRGTLRADVTRVTQDLATCFEHDIRRHPEQWHLFQPNWPSDPGYGS